MTRSFTNRRVVGLVLAVVLALAGIAAATAGARPIDTGPAGLPVFTVQTSIAKPTAVAAPASAVSSSDGFDFGAAAVGAGVIAAVALLIGAGNLTIRRRSQPEHT